MSLNKLEKELFNISEYLVGFDESLLDTIGVRYGKLGVALFHLFFFKHYRIDSHKIKGHNIILSAFEDVMNNKISNKRTIENIVDFGKTMEILKNLNFYYSDTNSYLEDLDESLFEECKILLVDEKDYDIVGGALSIGFYFIERYHSNKKVKVYLEEIIQNLYSISTETETGSIFWTSALFDKDRIYIGVHGSCSIIMFAYKLLELGISPLICQNIITSGIKFVVESIHDHPLCFFPIVIGYKIEKGPLEWVYGDLYVGYTLNIIGEYLKNENFVTLSKSVYDRAVTRINEEQIVADAGVVHGITGTSLMFYNMFLKMDSSKYRSISIDCCNKIFNFKNNESEYLGYKAKYDIDIPGSDISLSSGLSGIGISIISLIKNDVSLINKFLFI